MEVDLRLRFREVVHNEELDGNLDADFSVTEEEIIELKESLAHTLRATTFFINWGEGERSFMVSVSHINTKY